MVHVSHSVQTPEFITADRENRVPESKDPVRATGFADVGVAFFAFLRRKTEKRRGGEGEWRWVFRDGGIASLIGTDTICIHIHIQRKVSPSLSALSDIRLGKVRVK